MLDPVAPGPALARRVAVHELTVHAWAGRELRDLGDAMLLYDPADPEPFWNRIAAPDWPDDPGDFDRRLTEILALFAGLGRVPHVRTLAAGGRPEDLGARLLRQGFRRVGRDLSMVLVDPEPCRAAWAALPGRPEVTIERVGIDGQGRGLDVARLLVRAFDVESDRLPGLAAEAVAAGRRDGGGVLLLRAGGVPASVARFAAAGDAVYLSSVGTAPELRGRGYATIVTAAAVVAGLEAGARLVHLLVEAGNAAAIRLYRRLGFIETGDPISDLVLP